MYVNITFDYSIPHKQPLSVVSGTSFGNFRYQYRQAIFLAAFYAYSKASIFSGQRHVPQLQSKTILWIIQLDYYKGEGDDIYMVDGFRIVYRKRQFPK